MVLLIYFNSLFLLFRYLDSGLESEFIQDGIHIGNGDNSPTVEDGTQQDETKNGHLGNLLFFVFVIFLSFILCWNFWFLLLFYFDYFS